MPASRAGVISQVLIYGSDICMSPDMLGAECGDICSVCYTKPSELSYPEVRVGINVQPVDIYLGFVCTWDVNDHFTYSMQSGQSIAVYGISCK